MQNNTPPRRRIRRERVNWIRVGLTIGILAGGGFAMATLITLVLMIPNTIHDNRERERCEAKPNHVVVKAQHGDGWTCWDNELYPNVWPGETAR